LPPEQSNPDLLRQLQTTITERTPMSGLELLVRYDYHSQHPANENLGAHSVRVAQGALNAVRADEKKRAVYDTRLAELSDKGRLLQFIPRVIDFQDAEWAWGIVELSTYHLPQTHGQMAHFFSLMLDRPTLRSQAEKIGLSPVYRTVDVSSDAVHDLMEGWTVRLTDEKHTVTIDIDPTTLKLVGQATDNETQAKIQLTDAETDKIINLNDSLSRKIKNLVA
jgi:hypothetical protein